MQNAAWETEPGHEMELSVCVMCSEPEAGDGILWEVWLLTCSTVVACVSGSQLCSPIFGSCFGLQMCGSSHVQPHMSHPPNAGPGPSIRPISDRQQTSAQVWAATTSHCIQHTLKCRTHSEVCSVWPLDNFRHHCLLVWIHILVAGVIFPHHTSGSCSLGLSATSLSVPRIWGNVSELWRI